MKYTTKVKSALALAMSLMVGMASAAKTEIQTNQVYGATFDATVVATENDATVDNATAYPYGAKIGTLHTTGANATGWFAGSEDDESVVTNVSDNVSEPYLLLNTDSSTLTNKFAGAADVNAAIAGGAVSGSETKKYEGAFFETEVKFVASDGLNTDIAGGQDATKFAIYAYCDDTAEAPNNTTNLVVFHAVFDTENSGIAYCTNEVFKSVNIDVTKYTKIRVEMKKLVDPEDLTHKAYNAFSVTIDGETIASPTTALDKAFDATAPGQWFMTVESDNLETDHDVSSINFKGTGEIDNIKVGQILKETYVATVDGTNYATWAAAKAKIGNGSVVTAFEDTDSDIVLSAGSITVNANGYTVGVTTSTQGKKVVGPDANGVYEVVDDVTEATVISVADGTETGYPTLAEALAAAVAGDTVKLNSDVEVDYTVSIEKDLILDLGGNELTSTAIREGEDVARVLTASAGNVVVTNGTISGRVNCYDTAALTIAADTTVDGYVLVWGDGTAGEAGCKSPTLNVYGSVRAEGSQIAVAVGASDMSAPTINVFDGAVISSPVTGVLIYNGTTFTMTGGSITGGDFGVANNGNGTVPTTIAISGGTVTSTNQTNSGCGIYQAGPGALTLSGTAVVSGPDAVEVRAGSVQVLDNARLVATMPYTDPASNTGGNSGHGGVALLISQHTTAHPVSATVDGGTLTGAVAFAEVTVEASNDASKIAGAINGGVLYGSVVSEDVEGLIPSTSTALFSDSEPEGLPEGFEVVEDLPDHPGLYKVQAQTFTVIFVANNETFATSNNIAYNAQVAAPDPAPTKADDDTYTYSFKEWQLDGVAYDFTTGVTSNFTLVADFTATEKPAPSAGYAENDEVNGVTLTQAQADWLNGLYGEGKTYADKATFAANLPATADIVKCYLLNCDPTVANAGGTLTVTAITVGTDVKVTVELARTGAAGAIKGTLKLFGTADLGTRFEALGDTEFTDDDFSGGNTTTATFTGSGAKFFKAVIE